jgi:signal transduction histidine kinase
LGRIFEPFFTTKGDLGTGIGLWVTRQLVEKRSGQLSVVSNTDPGKSGTVVTLFVPFSAPARKESA